MKAKINEYLKEEPIIEVDYLKEGKVTIDLFKDILPSIMQTKKPVINDENANKYPAFMINRALSYHIDCLNAAQQLNLRTGIPNKAQYLFLINTIRKAKRSFTKWVKKEVIEEVELVAEYYNISLKKAEEALPCLTKQQIQEIREKMDKGGK